ncbi:MAG: glutamyl-or glutaminyl-tRNA synthetase [uncultured bacterium]|nr:MAG: glutamyl-or glutaminyl-tRNA synthetase [uncultured bacterium]
MQDISTWLTSQSKIVTRAGVCPFISAKGSIALAELRTHLFNYLIARYAAIKGKKGIFILRCDDTDTSQTDTTLMPLIVSMFNDILEAKPDLHPYNSEQTLKYPLIQSKRNELYEKYIAQLEDCRILYKKKSNDPFIFSIKKYIEHYGNIIQVNDLLLGNFTYDLLYEQRIHDFPLTRANGNSLWHLCSVVDDFNCGVNLVIRAQDKIGNIPYQEMIRSALNLPFKAYLHLPLMLPDKNLNSLNFLSTVNELMKEGISSRAIVIYLVSSLFNQENNTYLNVKDFLFNLDFYKLKKTSSRFNLNKLYAINKKLQDNFLDNDYLKELSKCAAIKEDTEWNNLLSKDFIKKFLLGLRLDYIKSRVILNSLINPSYLVNRFNNYKETLNLLNELEKNDANFSIIKKIRILIIENKSLIPLFRWILTGEISGISIFKILDFLEQSKFLLIERINTAKNSLVNHLKTNNAVS